MAALTAPRNTISRDGRDFSIQAAASKTFHQGALLARDAAGKGTPGAAATTLRGLGRVKKSAVSGASDVVPVEYERGTFRYGNSASGDAITTADIGNDCYIVDDQTVAKTDGSSTRSVAGVIRDVDSLGVWVEF